MKYVLLLILFTVSCNAFDNYACDPLEGVFHTTWKTLDGDCGDVGDTVVIITASTQRGQDSERCHYDYDTISPNQCTETSDYTCTDYDTGTITVWHTYLHAEDEHSNHLKEDLTITLYYIGKAEQVCQGTYEVNWSRD